MESSIWELHGNTYVMREDIRIKYEQELNEQLADWLKGNNRHTKHIHDDIETECCPDMSCCGLPAWSNHDRQRFVEAGSEERTEMLMTVLRNFTKDEHLNVYVAP